MRRHITGIALLFATILATACAAPPKKPVQLDNDSLVSDTCCCRWTPIGAENGRASYEDMNRMECSEKQGDCMAASNCAGDQSDSM